MIKYSSYNLNTPQTINKATTTTDGLLSSQDKTKLNSIETNATSDQLASEVPVSLIANNYSALNQNVEAHLFGIHSEIGVLQTQLVGGVSYKGGYDPITNTPDLLTDTSATKSGDMYTVIGLGSFYTAQVSIGDVLIAEVNNPTTIDDWTIVETNLEDASDVGYVNTSSSLTSTNVQSAIDEVNSNLNSLNSEVYRAGDFLISGGGSAGSGSEVSLGFAFQGNTTPEYTIAFNQSDTSSLNIKKGSTTYVSFNESQGVLFPALFNLNLVNYLPEEKQSLASHFQSIDSALGKKKTHSAITRQVLTGPVFFTNLDTKYQNIVITSNQTGTLPSSPEKDKHFIIKNSPTSTGTFTINGVSLLPKQIYEVLYDGVEWVIL